MLLQPQGRPALTCGVDSTSARLTEKPVPALGWPVSCDTGRPSRYARSRASRSVEPDWPTGAPACGQSGMSKKWSNFLSIMDSPMITCRRRRQEPRRPLCGYTEWRLTWPSQSRITSALAQRLARPGAHTGITISRWPCQGVALPGLEQRKLAQCNSDRLNEDVKREPLTSEERQVRESRLLVPA